MNCRIKQPSFRNSAETKDNILAEWLKEWIDTRMQQGKSRFNDLLPSKNENAERAKCQHRELYKQQ